MGINAEIESAGLGAKGDGEMTDYEYNGLIFEDRPHPENPDKSAIHMIASEQFFAVLRINPEVRRAAGVHPVQIPNLSRARALIGSSDRRKVKRGIRLAYRY